MSTMLDASRCGCGGVKGTLDATCAGCRSRRERGSVYETADARGITYSRGENAILIRHDFRASLDQTFHASECAGRMAFGEWVLDVWANAPCSDCGAARLLTKAGLCSHCGRRRYEEREIAAAHSSIVGIAKGPEALSVLTASMLAASAAMGDHSADVGPAPCQFDGATKSKEGNCPECDLRATATRRRQPATKPTPPTTHASQHDGPVTPTFAVEAVADATNRYTGIHAVHSYVHALGAVTPPAPTCWACGDATHLRGDGVCGECHRKGDKPCVTCRKPAFLTQVGDPLCGDCIRARRAEATSPYAGLAAWLPTSAPPAPIHISAADLHAYAKEVAEREVHALLAQAAPPADWPFCGTGKPTSESIATILFRRDNADEIRARSEGDRSREPAIAEVMWGRADNDTYDRYVKEAEALLDDGHRPDTAVEWDRDHAASGWRSRAIVGAYECFAYDDGRWGVYRSDNGDERGAGTRASLSEAKAACLAAVP